MTKQTSPLDTSTLLGFDRDRRRGNLYDRVRLPAGETPRTIELFRVPIGHGEPVKTSADTNALTHSDIGLPPPYDMIVDGFMLLFQPSGAAEDRDAFLATYYWEFTVLERRICGGPALLGAMEGDVEAKGKEGLVLRPLTEDAPKYVRKIGQGLGWSLRGQYSVYLPPVLPFAVRLYSPHSVVMKAPLDFYVMLDGIRGYPIQ